jgi:polysaccharide pyruvyl transferase WcaK-like protein
MLETPVELTVEKYDQATIAEHLARVDGVVFAGGPLMDLPKQLTKHLYTVSLARRLGKPFVVEGIGVGPFARRESEWVARRLVLMADRVAVRTNDDAEKRLVVDLQPVRGRDPAFDYLETRGEVLTRIAAPDEAWLERLLEGPDEHVTVGLNIRPIRHIFTTVSSGGDQSERTVDVEGRLFHELGAGLRSFQERLGKPLRCVFFPMNAIQFGMSDMRSAYRLGRELGSDIDYRVWEGDASLDGVLELLRRIDIVVAMRFHAVIFALSQARPVVGIDYRVGKRDKVAAVLDDSGFPDDYRRIDEITGDWLVGRLEHQMARVRGGPARAPGR